MGKFVGPGYVRAGPGTAGCFGVGCLVPTVIAILIAILIRKEHT